MGKAYSSDFVKGAFLLNGMIDRRTHTVPSMQQMFDTCRRSLDEVDGIGGKRLLSQFYSRCYLNGMVSEDDMDRFNLPEDVDTKGKNGGTTN